MSPVTPNKRRHSPLSSATAVTSAGGGDAGRKLRTDAARNRERILAVAKEVFARDGSAASLDGIAKQAGLGSGTLYRHFPTRDQLVEAVYRTDTEKLAATAGELSTTHPPLEALRAWMVLFVDYIAAKQVILPVLNSVPGGSERLYQGSSALIHGAVSTLVGRAIRNADLREDIDPWELLLPLYGVSLVPLNANWPDSAKRLVDVLIRGSRPSGSPAN